MRSVVLLRIKLPEDRCRAKLRI